MAKARWSKTTARERKAILALTREARALKKAALVRTEVSTPAQDSTHTGKASKARAKRVKVVVDDVVMCAQCCAPLDSCSCESA